MAVGPSYGRYARASLRPAFFAAIALAGMVAATDRAGARAGGSERTTEAIAPRAAGEPILAIVSLKSQRITVYDDKGWILRAPVSSGQKGRETPAGIFSVIQKEAEHYSNLYDDAFMPNMQRITWSGIALHGGALPGYPASHGCIRMPYDFAERLFDVTQLGLRVIVAPTDVVPVEISHPLLFQPKPGAGAAVAARIAEADAASMKADRARGAAGAAYRDAMQAMVPVRAAENLKRRAEAQLAAAEAALASASSEEAKQQAEDAKAKAASSLAELDAQWSAAKAKLQPKLDAVMATREAALNAEAAQTTATEAARQASRELQPVSVLISRKTGRLYLRQGFEPLYDGPVTIQDPDRPIGTHVFTAVARTDDGAGLRWSVVSLEGSAGAESMPRAADSAKAALDRIVIPQETLDRIPGAAARSSIIVTDEAPSSETGKGTDFIVLLSGEPQGGIKFRRHGPTAEYGYAGARGRQPYWGTFSRAPFSTW